MPLKRQGAPFLLLTKDPPRIECLAALIGLQACGSLMGQVWGVVDLSVSKLNQVAD